MTLRERLRGLPDDVRLFLLFLALLLPLRAVHTAGVRWMFVDGGLYTEVARNVRDGLGLVSNLSLYHAGYPSFPYPTPLYPLWPLLLGHLARFADLATLAHWLPTALYFTALVGAFLFGRRLWPEPFFPAVAPGFHAGHVFVLLLAVHRHFVYFTSLPYTEGLSWTLLLFFLWRLVGRSGSTSLGWAVELGAWVGALYLCRSQFLLVPIAVTLGLGARVLVGPARGRALAHALVTLAVVGAAIGGWFAYLRTIVPDASLQTLLRFDQNQATDVLEPLDILVEGATLADTLRDRLEGVRLAWQASGDHTYGVGFLYAQWALPLALPFLLVAGARAARAHGARGLLAAARAERAFAWIVLLLLAGGGLLSIHLAHKQFNGSWYFGQRQSLVCILAFFLCTAWMLRTGRPAPTALAAVVLGATTLVGFKDVYREAVSDAGSIRDPDAQLELVRWFRRHASEDAPIVVAMAGGDVNRVGWRVRGVGFHMVYETTSYADLLDMMDQLGARYFFHRESSTRSWRFRTEGAGQLEHDFVALDDTPDGHTVLVRRDEPPAPLPPQRVLLVGVDGASWTVMGPMIERGELPTFGTLLRQGASQTAFGTLDASANDAVWTSIATGLTPDAHGVGRRGRGAARSPSAANHEALPTLWSVASDAGLRVSAVGWAASWPAGPVQGTVVTDHANPAAAWARWADDGPAPADARSRDTWPPDLASALASAWVAPDAFPLAELGAWGRFSEAQLAQLAAAPLDGRGAYGALKSAFALDLPHVRIARDQLRAAPADLTLLYLRGPDPVQQAAWDTVQPLRYAREPENLARDRGVVQGAYRATDALLAELLAEMGPDTTLLLLSDHGAEPNPDRAEAEAGRPGGHGRDAKGVLFLYGPHVRPGARIARAGPLDVAPTVRWALGLPVADDLPGRVLAEAFDLDFRARRGRVRAPTWSAPAASPAPPLADGAPGPLPVPPK